MSVSKADLRSRRPFLKQNAFTEEVHATKALLRGLKMETVCESARCPNLSECFARPTATFMILGAVCTRSCAFCAVNNDAHPQPPDAEEPARLAEAARKLGLKHVVITSVTRDDLADGGAAHFAACIRAVRAAHPSATVEILTPDFAECREAALDILDADRPDVFNHNVETVPRLQLAIRPRASWSASTTLLARAAARWPGLAIKTGLMVGLGETEEEIAECLATLAKSGATHLTLGQYFQPTRANAVVARYHAAEDFARWEQMALGCGFAHVASGPYVRSSYWADLAVPKTA